MSLILTYWEDPITKEDPADFDGILEVRLKSVSQIPDLIAARPAKCTMISVEYSGDHKRKGKLTNPTNPRRFKEVWAKGQPVPTAKPKTCPLCGRN